MPWNKDPDNEGLLAHEVEAVIAQAASEAPLNPTSAVADRWPVLWLVLWTTGRRLGEALAITAECVRPAALWYIPLKKKRREWAVCALKAHVAAALFRLIEDHRIGPHQRVFPMTHQGSRKALQRAATAAGVHRPKGVHPHMFRHGHAHQLAGSMIAAGQPSQVVAGAIKKALNHAGWANVAKYLEPSQAEVGAWQDRAFTTRPPR